MHIARRTRTGLAALAGTALLVPLLGTAPSTADPGGDAPDSAPVAAQVEAELATDGTADFWIHFRHRPDLSAAAALTDWDARGIAVHTQLSRAAEQSQAAARARLDADGATYHAFVISNAIRVTGGNASQVSALAADPEVDGIYPTFEVTRPDPVVEVDAELAPDAVEWGVADINADDVWALGHTGDGIVVGSIDTGVQFDHPALVGQYRGNNGDGTFTHDYNWFDAAGSSPAAPSDGDGHGTHTTGTMVGDDGGANQIGVAPGATWIAANGCCPSDLALIQSMEWMLAPTDLSGGSPDPTKRPHIINNSWGTIIPSNDPFGEDAQLAWNAAGIFGVFSNGNSGPGCTTSGSPGSRTINYSVGNYTASHAINPGSARGSGQDGTIKPNISAPGTAVRSSFPGGSYATGTGTSMAAPHVAGSVALLWSASPGLIGDIDATRSLLDGTAINSSDLTCGGSAADNNVFGEGRLDVLAAVQEAPDDLAVIRLSGPNRYATAVAISQDYSPGVGLVYVATGANFPDALAVSPLAGNSAHPVLLTKPDSLPAVVAAELTRLAPGGVQVLGGEAAVSDEVVDAIDAATGAAPVTRIAGANRYETAQLIAFGFPAPDEVYVATGVNFPDALAAGPVGAHQQAPVLLTRTATLPQETIDYLEAVEPDDIHILGGTAAVSEAVATELAAYGSVDRVSGANRYATAALLSAELPASPQSYVASGENWPDALAGSARAGAEVSPVLLVHQDSIPDESWDALEARMPMSTIYLLGGTAAVSQGVRTELLTLDD